MQLARGVDENVRNATEKHEERNIPKNDDDYKKSVFTPTDESSARLYAEMDALETDSVINENLVSGAVKNALNH